MKDSLKLFKSPLVAFGFFFLINPYISMLDVLPDFIGYILIYFGVSELARIDDRLSLASQKLIFLSVISLGRLMAWTFSISADSSTVMMLCFTFGIVEGILAVLFANDFFGGMEYLLQRYDGYEALKILPNSRFLTVFFFLSKIVLGFIPELAAILEVEAISDITNSQVFTEIAAYKPYAIMLFGLILVIFGVIWYADTLKYFRTIRKSNEFLCSCGKAYDEYSTSDSDTVIRRTKLAFIFFCVGFVMFFDFQIERISLFQDFIGTLFIWCGLRLMRRFTKTALYIIPLLTVLVQIGYAVCFKLFGNTEVEVIQEFSLKNGIIMGIASEVCYCLTAYFIGGVYKSFGEIARSLKCKRHSSQYTNTALAFYAVYAVMTVFSVVYPLTYEWFTSVRMLLISIFIFMSIRSFWVIGNEYAEAHE